MPYRIKRNSWQPARLKRGDYRVLMVALVFIAYVRGLDYLIGDDVWNSRDFMLQAAPEWVWGGIGFVLGATILLLGTLTRRHLLVYVGHGWLGMAYFLNALAAILASQPWFFDGVRGGGAVGFVALLHFLQMWRTGAAPLRVDKPARGATERIVEGEE